MLWSMVDDDDDDCVDLLAASHVKKMVIDDDDCVDLLAALHV